MGVSDAGGPDEIDLLALNLDEAAALAGIPAEGTRPATLVEATLAWTRPDMQVTVTAGAQGSWVWDGKTLTHLHALPVQVVSTAGAGDAHLAGIVAGLAAGLPLVEAHQLGVLTAAVAVTSPHTINHELDTGALWRCASEFGVPLSAPVCALLEE